MSNLPECIKCGSSYTYEVNGVISCPECGADFTMEDIEAANSSGIADANGTPLSDGDTVTLIKDLKLKGSSQTIKVGTKVKNIRLVDGDHDIDCKIPGFGPMMLKSEFVKKV
tara:strand:- start:492 stop:827 length:336 start_codon:yes stop_codon:yes gene_type:complete